MSEFATERLKSTIFAHPSNSDEERYNEIVYNMIHLIQENAELKKRINETLKYFDVTGFFNTEDCNRVKKGIDILNGREVDGT